MHKIFTALLLAVMGVFVAFGETWVTDLSRGIELANSQGKKVLIYFHTDTCPYCLQMEEFVLGDPEVEGYMRERFVVVSLSLNDNRELARRFGVFGVPHFVVYDPSSERVLMSIYGSRDRDDFLRLLVKVCKKSNLGRC
jgi:thioredoxin-related protein